MPFSNSIDQMKNRIHILSMNAITYLQKSRWLVNQWFCLPLWARNDKFYGLSLPIHYQKRTIFDNRFMTQHWWPDTTFVCLRKRLCILKYVLLRPWSATKWRTMPLSDHKSYESCGSKKMFPCSDVVLVFTLYVYVTYICTYCCVFLKIEDILAKDLLKRVYRQVERHK